MRGAKPKMQPGVHQYTTLAIAEVEAGLIPWKFREDGEGDALVESGMHEAVEREE